MKTQWILLTLMAPIFTFAASPARLDPRVVAGQIQTDLETSLSHLLAPESYVLQVNVQSQTVSERRLVEGDTEKTQSPEENAIRPPANLPGFSPVPEEDQVKAGVTQHREVYKVVETEVLKSGTVAILLDQALPAETISDVRGLVRRYLANSFDNRVKADFQVIPFRHAPARSPESVSPRQRVIEALSLGMAALALLAALLALWRRKAARNAEEVRGKTSATLSAPSIPLAGKPPTAPAVDHRQELLNACFRSPEPFREYFLRLPTNARTRICDILASPAFDSFMENLIPDHPRTSGVAAQSDDAQDEADRHLRQFREYLQAQRWRKDRFFGFLTQLDTSQLVWLFSGEPTSDVASALMFVSVPVSAAVLEQMDPTERIAILSEMQHGARREFRELASIERSLRAKAESLPESTIVIKDPKLQYCMEVLKETRSRDLQEDIGRLKPELAELVRKYSFKLEDLPQFPKDAAARALGEADNRELALALAGLPEPVRTYSLGLLDPRRAQLIQSEIASASRHAPPHVKEEQARIERTITNRIRENLL